jgi:hypothetical protein
MIITGNNIDYGGKEVKYPQNSKDYTNLDL